LELDREASAEQISQAFRRLSLKFNPAKNPTNQASNAEKFEYICEAWEVLSNPELKGLFDKYGEYGLKNGVTNHLGQKVGGYIFLGNSEEIYDAFFDDPEALNKDKFHHNGTDVFGSLLGDAYKAKKMAKSNKPKDVTVTMSCSLIELYNGSLKTVKYSRDQIHPDGRSIKKVDEEL
jgi:DnaJ homolog subfamily B member 13